MAPPNIKDEDKSEFNFYEFDIKALSQPKRLNNFVLKNIEGFSKLWPDKNFEKIYARDSNDNKVVIFDIKAGKATKMRGIGKKIHLNDSSWLKANQLLYHCDEEGKRYLLDLNSNKTYLSNAQNLEIG